MRTTPAAEAGVSETRGPFGNQVIDSLDAKRMKAQPRRFRRIVPIASRPGMGPIYG